MTRKIRPANPETIRASVSRPYATRVPRRVLWRKKLNKVLFGILGLLVVANIIWGMDMADPRADTHKASWERKETILNVAEPTPALAKEEPKVETVEDKIRNVFGKDAEWAIRCFKSESGLRPNAIGKNRNGTRDYGVAQLNSVHCGKVKGNCEQAFLNVDTNLRIAKQIFDASGNRPWYGKGCR